MKILLIDYGVSAERTTYDSLLGAGYTVEGFSAGSDGLQALATNSFDLMVLDWSLAHVDGLSLLRKVRAHNCSLPVLILSARDEVAERVAALDHGADDYLVKPCHAEELCARLRVLIRRNAGRASPTIEYGPVVLDPAAHSVTCHGQPIALAAREFAVLQLLLENEGRVLSREQIEERLYGWQETIESNTTEVHIHHLRKKLGKDLILTVRGVGYKVPKRRAPSSGWSSPF